MAGHFRERGVAWRPHAKAFKCPAIAHLLRRAGAIGVTVAKVSEAEVMAAGGIDDILIAHLVVGPSKVARLAALQHQADVKVTVDHPDHVGPTWPGGAARPASTIGVLVDVDLGMKRTGVADRARPPSSSARQVSATPGLAVRRADGLRGSHPDDRRPGREARGHRRGDRQAAPDARRSSRPPALDAGSSRPAAPGRTSTPPTSPGITEIQAGGGIFACQYYTQGLPGRGPPPRTHACWPPSSAARPPIEPSSTSVRSRSASTKLRPVLRDYPNCRVVGLSAEHATIAVDSRN